LAYLEKYSETKNESMDVPLIRNNEESTAAETHAAVENLTNKELWYFLAMVVFFGVFGAFLYFYKPAYWAIENFFVEMKELGVLGFFILVLIYTIWVIILLPVTIVELFAGFVYRDNIIVPAAFCSLGKFCGLVLSYVIAQKFLKRNSLLNNKFMISLKKAIRADETRFIFLIRIAIFPMFLKNYGLAMLDVSFKNYIIVSTAVSTVFTTWHVFLGSQSNKFIENKKTGALEYVVLAIIILFTSALLIYLVFLTKRIMREVEEYSKKGSENESLIPSGSQEEKEEEEEV